MSPALAGRVLTADVAAAVSLPPFSTSAMDGYAVRAAELGDGPVPIAFRLAAGDPPRPLPAGAVAGIATGAPMPPGADAVVPVEDAEEVEGALRAGRPRARRTHPPRRRRRGVRPRHRPLRAGADAGAARGDRRRRRGARARLPAAPRCGHRDGQRARERRDAARARPDLRVEPHGDRRPVRPRGRRGRGRRDRPRRSRGDRGRVRSGALGRRRGVVRRRLGRPARPREGRARRARRPRGLLAGRPQAREAALVRGGAVGRPRLRRAGEPGVEPGLLRALRPPGAPGAPGRSAGAAPGRTARAADRAPRRPATTPSAAACARGRTAWSSTRPGRRTRT